jgi:hypothetical protein
MSVPPTVPDVPQAETSPLLQLLEPFPPEYIGKLPRVTCKNCSDYRKTCEEHRKERCDVCGSYISTKHIHLDYVGHADVTRRLLEVDPEWTWEPAAEDEHGLPVLDTDENGNPVGMWIRLTVLGVTRLGYGSCPSKQNDAVKVLIGDALRNAAMRFGVALDLWAKGDRADPSVENAVAAGGNASRRRPRQAPVEQRTDHEWLTGMEHRIRIAGSRQELTTLANELRARKEAGGCEPVHEAHLWALGKKRQADLDAKLKLPTNKDGSLSRSRASDEELAGAGAMTRQERRDHGQLERDTLAGDQKAGRSTTKDEGGPWATGSDAA